MKVNKNSPEFLKGQIRKASRMYEEQFLRQMVKAMRGTITPSKMTKPSMGEKIYMEQLDQEYVKQWSEGEGAGLADMIYNDIIEKYYPQLADKKPKKKVLGEKPVTQPVVPVEKFEKAKKIKTEPTQKSADVFIFENNQENKNLSLKSPWEGQVKSLEEKSKGQYQVSLEHGNGMRSNFNFFSGQAPRLLENQPGKGQPFLEIVGVPASVRWSLQNQKV